MTEGRPTLLVFTALCRSVVVLGGEAVDVVVVLFVRTFGKKGPKTLKGTLLPRPVLRVELIAWLSNVISIGGGNAGEPPLEGEGVCARFV